MTKGYYANLYTKLFTLFLFTVEDETDWLNIAYLKLQKDLNYRLLTKILQFEDFKDRRYFQTAILATWNKITIAWKSKEKQVTVRKW